MKQAARKILLKKNLFGFILVPMSYISNLVNKLLDDVTTTIMVIVDSSLNPGVVRVSFVVHVSFEYL